MPVTNPETFSLGPCPRTVLSGVVRLAVLHRRAVIRAPSPDMVATGPGLFTQSNPDDRRVVPDEIGERAVFKVVYVVLESQYQSSLSAACKRINAGQVGAQTAPPLPARRPRDALPSEGSRKRNLCDAKKTHRANPKPRGRDGRPARSQPARRVR